MATATNPRDIFFEHELAIQEEEAERAEEFDFDWEALDNIAYAMTDMICQNINEKLKKSFFGQFIKPHFFEKKGGAKSTFEEDYHAYGYCVTTYLKISDIDFTVPNNPFSQMAEELSDYTDLSQFMFILEMDSVNSDLSRFKSYEIRADISRSFATSVTSDFRDFTNLTQLYNAINKNIYPEYCDTMKKKVIYSIFEYDAIRLENDIDMEYIVNNYENTQIILNDFHLVNEMDEF